MFNVEEEIRDFLETALASTDIQKFYIGWVPLRSIPVNYLPVLMVWGDETALLSDQLTTCEDRYSFNINIRVVVNAYEYADQAGVEADKILDLQKALKQIMEERDSEMKPLDATVLGALRNNVTGLDYLYSNDIVVNYQTENEAGTQYFYADLVMSNVTRLNTR